MFQQLVPAAVQERCTKNQSFLPLLREDEAIPTLSSQPSCSCRVPIEAQRAGAAVQHPKVPTGTQGGYGASPGTLLWSIPGTPWAHRAGAAVQHPRVPPGHTERSSCGASPGTHHPLVGSCLPQVAAAAAPVAAAPDVVSMPRAQAWLCGCFLVLISALSQPCSGSCRPGSPAGRDATLEALTLRT